MKPMTNDLFRQYFSFPLTRKYGKVFDNDFNMAFDFFHPFLAGKNSEVISDELQQDIVDVLNGESKPIQIPDLSYQDGDIFSRDKAIVMIRSWGRLTGSGGLKLSTDVALAIQDSFANFIIDRLNQNTNEHGE
jgi:hypothetical protein